MRTVILKIGRMDCSSCAFAIDGELEDTDGIAESKTNYAKQQTTVTFDPQKITSEKIIAIIKTLEYDAVINE
ncbi:heavy-metal-associated domain-containing protein [Candidatus Microgenomates bacterium]|nr:heavy-metal-associated domain-containing protein [Candidatus Microgenomates bacterium]